MTSSTLACLMPLRSALNAASTPAEPGSCDAAGVAVFFGAVAGAGFDWLVFVVRGRSVVVEEFEFWPTTTPHVRTSKANTLSINKLLKTRVCHCVIVAPTLRDRG